MRDKLHPRCYRSECNGFITQRAVDKRIDREQCKKNKPRKVAKQPNYEKRDKRREVFEVFDRCWQDLLKLYDTFLVITDAEKREEMVLKNKGVILHCMRKYIYTYNNYFQLIGRGRLDVDSLKKEYPLFESVFQDLVRKKARVKRNTFPPVKRGQSR